MITYNAKQVAILQQHYRQVLGGKALTHEQIIAELSDLQRKAKAGSLDDVNELLYANIVYAGNDKGLT